MGLYDAYPERHVGRHPGCAHCSGIRHGLLVQTCHQIGRQAHPDSRRGGVAPLHREHRCRYQRCSAARQRSSIDRGPRTSRTAYDLTHRLRARLVTDSPSNGNTDGTVRHDITCSTHLLRPEQMWRPLSAKSLTLRAPGSGKQPAARAARGRAGAATSRSGSRPSKPRPSGCGGPAPRLRARQAPCRPGP
jgi:hypothetical protein